MICYNLRLLIVWVFILDLQIAIEAIPILNFEFFISNYWRVAISMKSKIAPITNDDEFLIKARFANSASVTLYLFFALLLLNLNFYQFFWRLIFVIRAVHLPLTCNQETSCGFRAKEVVSIFTFFNLAPKTSSLIWTYRALVLLRSLYGHLKTLELIFFIQVNLIECL